MGVPITGLAGAEAVPGVEVFHAGTALRDGRLVTAGGRVLGVTAVAPDLEGAIARAYEAAGRLHFEGIHYRRDIGRRQRRAP
jgi:phosphoribosylamine--glycine ligase